MSSIFIGPYITRFIRGIGYWEKLEGQVIIGYTTSLGMDTLRSIRMVMQ